MNTKRQTVWLVSMLSIMVVLSAYYLFTDDVDEMQVASDDILSQEITLDYLEQESAEVEGIHDTEGTTEVEEGKLSTPQEDGTVLEQMKTDEEILQEVQAGYDSGYGYFETLHLNRQEEFAKETEQLLSAIVDSESVEAQTKFYNDLSLIEERETKLTFLEGEIMKQFENAIITEEAEKWKVIVQTDQMEKSQAVSIIEMVMKEMNASANQVVVQMKP
jgi:stage III sporulation protein AH